MHQHFRLDSARLYTDNNPGKAKGDCDLILSYWRMGCIIGHRLLRRLLRSNLSLRRCQSSGRLRLLQAAAVHEWQAVWCCCWQRCSSLHIEHVAVDSQAGKWSARYVSIPHIVVRKVGCSPVSSPHVSLGSCGTTVSGQQQPCSSACFQVGTSVQIK